MSNNRVCHFKLVLLGDTAVGKSCLVVRFVRDEFFEFQEPTIGGKQIDVIDFHYEVTDGTDIAMMTRPTVVLLALWYDFYVRIIIVLFSLHQNCRHQSP